MEHALQYIYELDLQHSFGYTFDMEDKVRENRLRRMAERQGYILQKSKRRDPRARDFGLYTIVDADTNGVIAQRGGSASGLNIDQVEAWLNQP